MALDVIEGKIGMLELSPPVTFEPVGPVTTVFFDDKNQQVDTCEGLKYDNYGQVFSVRSGGATGVTIKSPHGEPPISLVINIDDQPTMLTMLKTSQSLLYSIDHQPTMYNFH